MKVAVRSSWWLISALVRAMGDLSVRSGDAAQGAERLMLGEWFLTCERALTSDQAPGSDPDSDVPRVLAAGEISVAVGELVERVCGAVAAAPSSSEWCRGWRLQSAAVEKIIKAAAARAGGVR
jgi:hypothetical protein